VQVGVYTYDETSVSRTGCFLRKAVAQAVIPWTLGYTVRVRNSRLRALRSASKRDRSCCVQRNGEDCFGTASLLESEAIFPRLQSEADVEIYSKGQFILDQGKIDGYMSLFLNTLPHRKALIGGKVVARKCARTMFGCVAGHRFVYPHAEPSTTTTSTRRHPWTSPPQSI
jgi:hypothetical protein